MVCSGREARRLPTRAAPAEESAPQPQTVPAPRLSPRGPTGSSPDAAPEEALPWGPRDGRAVWKAGREGTAVREQLLWGWEKQRAAQT